MDGFIYIMSNPAFKDRIKIGISKSDPTGDRASSLYSTGVPEPFKVEYYAFVEDYEILEKVVHAQLGDKRNNFNREFFSCSIETAIVTIKTYAKKINYEKVFYISPEKIENEKKRQGQIEIERINNEKKRQEQIEIEKRKKEELDRITNRKRKEEWDNRVYDAKEDLWSAIIGIFALVVVGYIAALFLDIFFNLGIF